ncbi:hypothetical protein BJX64DRAFT_66420 [Aspergillus heterothallicus]
MPRIRPPTPSLRLFSRIGPSSRYISTSAGHSYVKVQRPWFRRLVTKCLVFGVAIYAWSGFVLAAYDDSQEHNDLQKKPPTIGDHKVKKTEKTEHKTETDSEGLFIPLGWPQLREGKFYKASDPEWKAFIEISKNEKKMGTLKGELASIVLAEASRSEPLSRLLGSPFKITQYWLQPHWPSRAPPAYHQSGVLVTDNGILWASHSMSDKASDTLHRSMRPFLVALAVKDAYLVFWKRLINRFNISDSSDEEALNLPRQKTKTLLPSDFKNFDNLNETSPSEAQLSPSASSEGSSNQVDQDSRPHSSIFLSILQRLPLPKPGPGSDLYTASLVFKERLNESRAHESRAPHRGTFFIRGPVGLRGTLGFCRVEVEGEYDPKTSSWVSVSGHLRDVAVFQQKALGG